MHKGFLKTAALTGALSVMLGAFAAHGLKAILSADDLQIFDTAVKYQFYHVFTLLVVGILYKEFPGKLMEWAGRFLIMGMLLFCGSLYVLCYVKYHELPLNWLGAITPFGGVSLITGWLLVFVAIVKRN